MRSQPQRGFSMVELMAVLAIIGVVAALATVSFATQNRRGNYRETINVLLTTLRSARAQAYAKGWPIVVIIDAGAATSTHTPGWWVINDPNGTFNLSSFDPTNPTASISAPQTLMSSGTLPSTVNFASAGYGGALPVPYGSIPANNGCTFCTSGTTSAVGSLTFNPGGGVLFNQSSAVWGSLGGGSFSLQSGSTNDLATMALVQRTGAVEMFTK